MVVIGRSTAVGGINLETSNIEVVVIGRSSETSNIQLVIYIKKALRFLERLLK